VLVNALKEQQRQIAPQSQIQVKSIQSESKQICLPKCCVSRTGRDAGHRKYEPLKSTTGAKAVRKEKVITRNAEQ
jgi:hypothetical protein